MELSSRASGYILAFAQAVLYALMGVFAKLLYNTDITPQQVMILRFVPSTIILAAVILTMRKGRVFSRTPIVYVQSLFFTAAAYLYMMAVDELTAGLATVIFFSNPAMVAVIAAFAFRERITLRTLIALVLALVGIVLISGVLFAQTVQLSPIGLTYAIGSCIAFAVYAAMGQATMKKEDQLSISFTTIAVTAILMVALYPMQIPALFQMDAMQWTVSLLSAVLCTTLPIPMLLAAIGRIGATKTSLIGISETPFSLLFAFLLLGEMLTAHQGAGTLLVMVSILVTTLAAPSTSKLDDEGG